MLLYCLSSSSLLIPLSVNLMNKYEMHFAWLCNCSIDLQPFYFISFLVFLSAVTQGSWPSVLMIDICMNGSSYIIKAYYAN